MKTLPDKFVRKGDIFRVVERDGNAALLTRTRLLQGQLGKYVQFEVVVIQQNPEREMHGVVIEASESMPGENQWGAKGWTFLPTEEARARAKYEELRAEYGAKARPRRR